jgi:hypothetical protein
MVVAILGCVALAVGIGVALLWPLDAERRRRRPLANTGRLTGLAEYVREKRRRTITAVVTLALLAVMFCCAVVAGSRPTGSFTSARELDRDDPEDVMLCVGGPVGDPAASATLRYFADRVDGFGTERIGLTSANRRVVPLTRDYQYAKETLSTFAGAQDRSGDLGAFSPNVSYSDYAQSVEDQVALCLTGFPDFDRVAPQRRSMIYVGPGELRRPGDPRPALFTADRVRELTTAAGVQFNAVVTDGATAFPAALARATGGRQFPADSAVAARLADIRSHPPARRSADGQEPAGRAAESPDIALIVAVVAAAVLAAWPVVWRR